MKLYEVFGSISAIIFALILFFSLASNPPIHSAWMRGAEELMPPDLGAIGEAISLYLWVNLYPALVAFIMVAVAFAVALVALLRRGE